MTQVRIKKFVSSSQNSSRYYVCNINLSLERETFLQAAKEASWWRGAHLTAHRLQRVVLQDQSLMRRKRDITARIAVMLKNEYIKQTAIRNFQNILQCTRSFSLSR